MKSSFNRSYNVLIFTLGLIVIIIICLCLFWLYPDKGVGPNVITAFAGAAVSALITFLVLRGQTIAETEKDRNIKLFVRKMKTYSDFNKILWRETGTLENDQANQLISELSNYCMQHLILDLNCEQINRLNSYLTAFASAIKDDDSKTILESRSKITLLLKNDLDGNIETNDLDGNIETNEDYKKDKKDPLLTAIMNLSIDKWNVGGAGSIMEKIELKDSQNESLDKARKSDENITYWHFCELYDKEQQDALKSDRPFLSLIEYGEKWRTNLLMQVKPNDIVFLFKRGGEGYIGMYKALGVQIIERIDDNKVRVFEGNNKPEEKELKEVKQYDIYDALSDGADFVSNIFVEEKRIKSRGQSSNPIYPIRYTIARPNQDNVDKLLSYFNEK